MVIRAPGWLAIAAALLLGMPALAEPEHSHGHGAMQKTSGAMPHATMHHGKLEVPNGPDVKVPAVTLSLLPDAGGDRSYALFVDVRNFRFDPANVNLTSDWNAGHAHLFINGRKITRLYGPWYFIDALPSGKAVISVTLNSNKHEELFHNGRKIEASITVE